MLTGIQSDAQTSATVAAAHIEMTRTGDTYSQMCFQTQVKPGCQTRGAADTFANAITTNNGVVDPSNGSGRVSFTLSAGSECLLHITKKASTANPQPGQVVTFTIVVSNIGTVDYTGEAPAAIDDNMASALKYGSYNNNVVASSGATVYAAPHLTWSGPIAHGASVTLTYSMTVKPTAPRGVALVNVVSAAGPNNCTIGSIDPVCKAVMKVVQSPLRLRKVESTSSPSVGGLIKYTITITNVGRTDYNAAAPAVMYDRMGGVLPYASYVSGRASLGTLKFAGSTLVWRGALLHGKSAVVTYYVKVKPSATGHKLRNYVQSPDPSNCSTGGEAGCYVGAYVAPAPAHTGI
jgi:hypothetical protein